MAFRIYKNGKTADYHLIDRQIAESYRIGGTDAFVYTYQGPTGNAGSTDLTKPDYTKEKPTLTSIGNLILGETPYRDYSLEAIVVPVIFQVQEDSPEIKLPGMFFNFNTMEITLHYNTMIKLIGRKLTNGDVIELPNMRDTDLLDNPNVCINRFYKVDDAYRASEGYSATWLPHIFKLRVKPLTNSPEFSKLLYDGVELAPDGSATESDPSVPSAYTKEIEIMNIILAQTEKEVPYIHWDNEHLYDDLLDINLLKSDVATVTALPNSSDLQDGLILILQKDPVLYEKQGTDWVPITIGIGEELPNPENSEDGDVFFRSTTTETTGYMVFQFNSANGKWEEVIIPSTNIDTVPLTAHEYYYWYDTAKLYKYNAETATWSVLDSPIIDRPFTSKDIAGNRYIHDDLRDEVPPSLEDTNKGIEFPANPADKDYFYRIDTFPPVLWQYDKANSKWVQFNYGGRQPWSGANKQKTDFLNSDNRVSIHDVVKPNIKY